jgi:hypothetical protein
MEINVEKLKNRINEIKENSEKIKKYSSIPDSEFWQDERNVLAIKHLLLQSIEACGSICSHVLAKKLNLSREEIIRESLQFYLGKKIREIKTDIYKIRSKYGVSSIEDFEEKYKKGEIEEKDSWQEFQQLDHLEYKKEELEKTLATLK